MILQTQNYSFLKFHYSHKTQNYLLIIFTNIAVRAQISRISPTFVYEHTHNESVINTRVDRLTHSNDVTHTQSFRKVEKEFVMMFHFLVVLAQKMKDYFVVDIKN